MTDPKGNVIAFTYDALGKVRQVTDSNGNSTLFERNYRGKVTRLTDALGNPTLVTYGRTGCSNCGGGLDQLTTVTDAKLHVTAFQYDAAGRLIAKADHLGQLTNYTVDALGNLISRTDPNGHTILYTRDQNGRLTSKTYPDASQVEYRYDANGKMIYAGNPNIAYSMVYDADNRVTSITDSNARAIQYQYDSLGNRIQMTTPDGRTISYAYDAVNRLTGILFSPGLYNFQFSYDASGKRTGLTYPNGITTTYSYDPASNLTNIVAQKPPQSTIDSFSFIVDGMGNRTSITDLWGLHSYAYDNIYQLLQGTHPTIPIEQFTYDPVGNRMTADGVTFGNPVSKTYTYDWENRLTKIEYSGMVAQYKYDPFGRRIEKSVNGDITTYFYDGPNIITEYAGNGNVKNAYLHSLAIDDPLAVQQGGQIYFYHKDGLGSITEITDASGNTIVTYRYNSFGEIISQSGNLIQPYTFTGREFDLESGLYYYRTRYYDPRTATFTSEDPIGLAGGDVNLYRYVKNVPLMRKDASGLTYEEGEQLLRHLGQRLLDKGYSPEQVFDMLRSLSGGAGTGVIVETGADILILDSLALAGSFAVGYLAGTLINYGSEELLGQPLGGRIYDWLHPEAPGVQGSRCGG